MTVCKQLNYLQRRARCLDYEERLVADGECGGRNWSYLERTWLRDLGFHGGKYQYILRIDVSEYSEGYKHIVYDRPVQRLNEALMLDGGVFGACTRFSVCNQSPGVWENGFNPNYWLNAVVGAYKDDEDRLRKIVEFGADLASPEAGGLFARRAFERLGPALDMLRDAAPVGTPYHYWWGVEEPPPPRKPVYWDEP